MAGKKGFGANQRDNRLGIWDKMKKAEYVEQFVLKSHKASA